MHNDRVPAGERRSALADEGFDRIVRRPEVLSLIGLGRTQLGVAIARGDFPAPFKITDGGRSVGWSAREVRRFIANRIAKRDRPAEAA